MIVIGYFLTIYSKVKLWTFSRHCIAQRSRKPFTQSYTLSQKNRATLYSCITSSYVDRFSKFFHCWIQQGICNKTLVIFPTTPYICCYTTLGNINVQIIQFSGSKLLQKHVASSTKQLMSGANVFVLHSSERTL